MKTNLKRTLMLTAAVLTLGAAAAYGQNTMTANVPFAFQTIGGLQAAGHYEVAPVSGFARTLSLRNLETSKAILLGIGTGADRTEGGRPRLVFNCGSESACVLTSVWLDDGRIYAYPRPHRKPSELERVAVIYLDRN
jgi:hypothetical protein